MANSHTPLHTELFRLTICLPFLDHITICSASMVARNMANRMLF